MKKLFTLILFLVFALSAYSQPRTVSGTVEFRVNTDIFIHNDDYSKFVNSIVPFVMNYSDEIETVLLVGSASPEGNYENNLRLADKRAAAIRSYVSDYIQDNKIVVDNNYDLFLRKTNVSESDYPKLRATYIEIQLKKEIPCDAEPIHDTIYIREYTKDVIRDTIYLEKPLRTIPILAFKTNLMSDLILAPNVQAELYTHVWGLSVDFSYTFPWYKNHEKFFYYQVLNGAAGIRKYLNNSYTGHYVGVYGNTAIYDICLFNKDKGWQGEAHGAGLTYGYVFQNKKHPRLKFELYARVGWLNTHFDSYHTLETFDDKYYYDWTGRASEFVPRRFKLNYFGPTAIGFNLTYDLICLRRY